MREIKFRGKTHNGKWAYGFGHQSGEYEGVLPFRNESGNLDAWFIKPETVGQYTGLKDRNGVEVYEGDICVDTRGFRFCVEWDDENARFLGHYEDRIRYVGQEPAVTVIGNIHDNPELMEAQP